MYYAQISGGRVVAVTQTAGVIESAGMISIDSLDETLIGATYSGGVFTRQPITSAPRVTMRQAKLALFAAGKLSAVESAISGLSEPTKTAAQIEWSSASVVERNSPTVALIASATGMTDAELDALFTAAAAL